MVVWVRSLQVPAHKKGNKHRGGHLQWSAKVYFLLVTPYQMPTPSYY